MTTDYSTLFDLMHLGGGTWRMKQSLCCCERDERVGPLARATAFRGTLIKLWIEEQSSPPFVLTAEYPDRRRVPGAAGVRVG